MKKIFKNSFKSYVFFCFLSIALSSFAQSGKEYLPQWQEGYLDIHQIASGRGNSGFAIFPDGTTMLIDAGDLGDRLGLNQEIMPALPNGTKLPGEWISIYIKHFTKPLSRSGKLDYALLTHFHNDHMGSVSAKSIKPAGRDYLLSGITQVAEYLHIDCLVDRGWPSYDYPSRKAIDRSNSGFDNYLRFLAYQQKTKNLNVQSFMVGADNQFVLKYDTQKYANFSIRNIYASGNIWSGKNEGVETLFPCIDSLTEMEYPSENMCSAAIKLSYGRFDYYTGGDVTGIVASDKPSWRDVETHVGRLVGPVEVAVANHHGFSDAENASFVSSLRPQAFILPVWDYYHPQPETLQRMVSSRLYPYDRYILATGLVDHNRERLGALAHSILPTGHVVVRVYDGGDKFQLFVLNANSLYYEVIYKSPLLDAN